MNTAADLELVWSSDYELGHSTIDCQHQQLFELYSRVVTAFANCKGSELIHRAVADLIAYTRFHFRDEEALMARLGYADLLAHQKEHKRLLTQVEAFADELQDGKPVLIYEVLVFLREWIHNHILAEDLKFKQHIKEWE